MRFSKLHPTTNHPPVHWQLRQVDNKVLQHGWISLREQRTSLVSVFCFQKRCLNGLRNDGRSQRRREWSFLRQVQGLDFGGAVGDKPTTLTVELD